MMEDDKSDVEKKLDDALGEEMTGELLHARNNKHLVMGFIIGGVVVLILLTISWIIYWQQEKRLRQAEEIQKQEEAKAAIAVLFYDLGNIEIALDTINERNREPSFLSIAITFELQGAVNLAAIKEYEPKLQDIVQTYLRELRPSDLHGSDGLYRLREALLLRVNKVIYPAKVEAVLFKDVVIR